MPPIRKKIDPSDKFPFALVYKERKNPLTELPDHLHEYYEVVYVHSGKGTFFIDQTFHDMREGDLFTIPGNTIHQAFPDQADPVTSTAVFFNPFVVEQAAFGDSFSYLSPFEQSKIRKHYRYTLSPVHRETVLHMFDQIYREWQDKADGYRQAIVLQLKQMLLDLHRRGSTDMEERTAPAALTAPPWMNEALLYIDEQLHGPLRLQLLATRANVTGAHFSRAFKQLTGMNVTDYITVKRIIRAKQLLFETDYTINTIAESCGFESMPHFHRTFKKIAGLTPAAYKKNKQLQAARQSP